MSIQPLPSSYSLPTSFSEDNSQIRFNLYQALCYHPSSPSYDPIQDPQDFRGMHYVYSKAREDAWGSEIKEILNSYPLDEVQSLYEVLRNIFPPEMINVDRLSVVRSFLRLSSTQWKELGLQINHLLPAGSRAHDIKWVAELLISILNKTYCEALIQTASNLFTWQTPSIHRGYILEGLIKGCPTTDALIKIQELNSSGKKTMAKTFIPHGV